MKVRVPDYYNDFSCLGSDCPDTCCYGWVIEIDDDTYEKYKKLPGELGDKIRKNIMINDEGKPVFKLNEDGYCSFLNDKKLCDLYMQLGEENQCALCANYPRIGDDFGSLREMGLSISCPNVARIILSKDTPVSYKEWDISDKIDGADISKDRMFNIVLELREIAMYIASFNKFTMHEKLGSLLILASSMQEAMDNNDYDALVFIASEYEKEGYIENVLKTYNVSVSNKRPGEFVKGLYKGMEKLDFLSNKWIQIVNKAYEDKDDTGYNYESFSNAISYFILRYFLKCVFDGDIYSKILFIVYSMLILEDLCKVCKTFDDYVEVTYLYSKEIEHCEENMEILYNSFWDEPFNNPRYILDIL